jgi:hypothetical protein
VSHTGPESRAAIREDRCEALTAMEKAKNVKYTYTPSDGDQAISVGG